MAQPICPCPLQTRDLSEPATGGGTDAAHAALETTAPVIERFGLLGLGAHSPNAEYNEIGSIEPRLALMARMIIDVARDAVR